ncbi:anti sigma factor C-terminal domain-containing protein [Chryseomicrobium sp. FSL W7-1435]|uniref:anti sigma factor C-terminal domain-containing protein n=1 Tax=Chryseomicrobium sp. FSL W7-1435 TaxID=2921704 RepID=UPI00315ACEA2
MSKENDFFPKDLEFEGLVKKAKRRSTLKMVIISSVISAIVLVGLYSAANLVMKIKMEKETDLDSAWSEVKGANVEERGGIFHYSITSATAKTKLVKVVGGVPIPWGEREKVFSIFGSSQIVSDNGAFALGNSDDARIPMYYEGERIVEFFHPKVDYAQLLDERLLLNEIEDSRVVEMALSFDDSYSIEQINEVFEEQVAWYWVDTFSEEQIERDTNFNKDENFPDTTVYGFEAYGFSHNPNAENYSASEFIANLEKVKEDGGDYQEDAERIITTLTNQGEIPLEPQSLRISGVIVTGKPSELVSLLDEPIIRGATLGATTDLY